jgi:hypothetical protein
MGTPLLLGAGTFATASAPYDPDAQAFFTAEAAAGVTLTSTQETAVNNLVVNLKAAGIWSKFRALYPIVGGTATAHKFNLINPADTDAAFRLVFSGGWVHSATGMLPNGTNTFANTFLSASANFTVYNTHVSVYSRTQSTGGNQFDMGYFASGVSSFLLSAYNGSVGSAVSDQYSNTQSRIQYVNTNTLGHYIGNRLAINNHKLYKNGSQVASTTLSSNLGLTNQILYLAAYRSGTSAFGNSAREQAFASIGEGLTDTEAQLFYQIVEGYQYELGRNVNPALSFYYNPAYSNETNLFLFSTQITDTTIQTATNTLVSDLKTANLWTKMKAIYPMVGGTATTHKYNLKDPQDTNAAFRLNFVGGWTHSSTGALPNGTNAYAQTFIVPATVYTNVYNISFGFYSRTNSVGNYIDIGVTNGAASGNPSGQLWAAGPGSLALGYNLRQTNTSANRILVSNPNTLGLHVLCSNLTTTQVIYKNGSALGSNTSNATQVGTYGFYLGAENGTGTANLYSNRQHAFSFFCEGLSATENSNLSTIVQTFNTTLGRQV